MPAYAPDLPLGLRTGDVKTSLVGWGFYMTALTCYCMLYEVVVSGRPPDLPGSIAWSLREWALWWFITPVALRALRRPEERADERSAERSAERAAERSDELWQAPPRRRVVQYLQLGTAILLAALAYRIAVEFLTEGRGIGTVVVIFLPRYVAALAAIFLLWHFFLRGKRAGPPQAAAKERPDPGSAERRYPDTLMVNKGSDRYPLRVARIECVSAAGNYVEIQSEDRRYLMRATMKEMEALLPPSKFIRVHRSHIVNRDEIERIRTRPSGGGILRLRGGREVSISKKHRSRLEDPGPQA